MSFCKFCGAEMNEGSLFCTQCGKSQQDNAPQKKSGKKLGIIIAAVAAVLLIAAVAIAVVLSSANDYKRPLDDLFAVMNGDFKKLDDLYPDAYWGKVGEDKKEFIKEIEDEFNEAKKYLGDVKYSYKINDKSKLGKDDLTELRENINEEYGIAKASIKEAYLVSVTITMKVNGEESTMDGEIVLVKIGNKWYVTDEDGEFVNF